mmetsp:Transcript_33744/g.48974  ORF Transcript_33744/g.48974 Transcript_33744/m.48974 type:complete len:314 (+) Transcript_33744:1-942(+)
METRKSNRVPKVPNIQDEEEPQSKRKKAESKESTKPVSVSKKKKNAVHLNGDEEELVTKTVVAEKRLRKYRSSAPQGVRDRIYRALSQRMFLIDCTVQDDFNRQYKVLGSTGNVYDVHIGKLPTCSCPDSSRGNLCKHVIFVLCRVLYQSQKSPYIYQHALLSSELREIFSSADSKGVAQAVQASKAVVDAATGRSSAESSSSSSSAETETAARPEGDCPICFEDMATGTESICSCSTCRNSLHSECMNMWLKNAAIKACPYCRSPWKTPQSSSSSSTPHRNEGYLNLAAVAGVSTRRDDSTYADYHRRYDDY